MTDGDELDDLRAVVRRFLDRWSPESHVREHLDSPDGFDRTVWRRLAQDIGVQGLAIPEEYGGAGFGMRELAVVAEELGYALCPGPFLSTVLVSATVLVVSGDHHAMKTLLPGIADGSVLSTLALPQHGSGWDCRPTQVTATRTGDEWTLSGTIPHVIDAQVADVLIVPARQDDGALSLFTLDAAGEGVRAEPTLALDQTRRFGHLTLSSARGTLLGEEGVGADILDRAMPLASVGLAADQLGGARRMLEATTEYAKTRHQFGRPIGSFQAVKHKLSDMFMEVELARAALDDAVRATAEGASGLITASSVAKVVCSETFYDVAATAIQLHGGIGFTWEHSAHLYFKRATSDRILLGAPGHHQERLAVALGLGDLESPLGELLDGSAHQRVGVLPALS